MKQTKTTAELGIEVGDVFVSTWGYDQTNVDFYEVVAVTPKSVKILSIGNEKVGYGIETRLLPSPGAYLEKRVQTMTTDENGLPSFEVTFEVPEPMLKRVQSYLDPYTGEDSIYLTMNTYSSASLWNGERSYFDTIAAGLPGH